MFVHYRTKGFVFKKVDRSEADQLFSVFTKEFGGLKILGRAIRKTTSKLRSGIDIFYLSDIEFIQGKRYKTLTGAVKIDDFNNVRKDLDRLEIAHKIGQALHDLIKGEEKDDNVWNLLLEVFEKLNDLNFKNIKLFYYYFFWNFLSLLGYQLDVYNCSSCEQKLEPEKLYFDFKKSTIVCGNCTGKDSFEKIGAEIVKILRIILKRDIKTISKLITKDKHIKSLKEISKNYYSFILNLSGQS